MKKILLTTLMLMAAIGVSAQNKGTMAVGPKISLYTNTGRGAIFGIGGYYRYNLTDPLRLETNLIVPCRSECSIDLNCNVQYLFEVADKWNIFPLVGLGVNDLGDWSCGVDLGAGTDYRITRHWSLSADLRWKIQTARFARNPIVLSIGTTFSF